MTGEQRHTAANQSIGVFQGICCYFALACLVIIQATNMSMMTTIQSPIAKSLKVYEEWNWFTSSYLITMSALGPLNGKLSSIFSPRKCIFFASAMLAIGGLICSQATTFATFIVGRVVSGVGASGIFTVSIIIVLELTGSKHKGVAIGALNSGYTVGVAGGATAAGALHKIIGWRPLFWLQSPIVLFGGLVLLFALPADFTAGSKATTDSERSTWERVRRIDFLGALTLTTSLVLLLFALSAPKKIPILPIILAIAAGMMFILIEAYLAHDPLIPVALLRSRGVLLTCLGTLGYMMARWSVLFFTPTYGIAVRQWSAGAGGALLIPTNSGFALGGITVGWFHIRRNGSFYLPTLVSYAIFPATLALLALVAHPEGSLAAIIVALFLCGFTTGAALNYNLAHLLHVTPVETHYVATALLATFRGFAGTFGMAIGSGMFTRTLSNSLTTHFAERGMQRDTLVRQLLGLPEMVSELSGAEREVAILGYNEALRTLWLAAALLAFITVFAQAGVGWKGVWVKKDVDGERQALLHEQRQGDTEEVI